MPTVSAAVQTGHRVAVTLEGLPTRPAAGDPWPAGPWSLFRTDGATEHPVRGAVERPLTDSAATVVYDQEAPLNRPITYVLRYVDATTGAVAVYAVESTVLVNKFHDPSFEYAVLGTAGGWAGSNADPTVDNTRAHTGSQSMKLTYSGSSVANASGSGTFEPLWKPDTTYCYTVWAWNPSVNTQPVAVRSGGAGIATDKQSAVYTQRDQWVQIVHTFTTTSDADPVVALYLYGSDGAAGDETWFDDLCIVEGIEPHTFTGDTPDTDTTTYAWTGTPGESTSTRTVTIPQWVTVEAELPILSNPVTGTGADVTIVEWPERSRSARSTILEVAGRTNPYVVSGLMSGYTSTMVLQTVTEAQRRTLDRLLDPGAALYLRATCAGIPEVYLAVTEAAAARWSPRTAGDTRRTWTLTVTEVDQPHPKIEATGDTLADLDATFPGGTLDDIAGTFVSLLELAETDLGVG